MTPRVVYDTMVFLQWAALPEGRLHGTAKAVLEGSIKLCVSFDLLAEVKGLLTRPAIVARLPNLTSQRVEEFLDQITQQAELFQVVPHAFTWPQHPDDDHVFNLAITAGAKHLVTWESRILSLRRQKSPAAKLLHELAPELSIITPAQLAAAIRTSAASESRE